MRHLDLFSGIGGFALAAQWAGFNTVGFAEIDPFCSKVLNKHWPRIQNFGDIRVVPTLPAITLMTGGFPCQPFSSAGKRKGKSDARYLWPELHTLINRIKPRYFVGENVNGIVDMELDNVLDDLENSGYETQSFIIPASAVGAPHRRERVWIIAHSLRERCHHRVNTTAQYEIKTNWERNITTSKSEWAGLFPKSWSTFDFKEWMQFATDSPSSEGKRSHTTVRSKESGQRFVPRGENSRNNEYLEWKEDEPPFPGVDDGLPDIVDRNKSLGNAIVPQVAYPILRAIALIEGSLNDKSH